MRLSKLAIFISSLFAAQMTHANIAELFTQDSVQQVCSQVLDGQTENAPLFTYDQESHSLFVAQRVAGVWTVSQLNNPDKPQIITELSERVHGLKYSNNKLWVLFRDKVRVIDAKTGDLSFEATTNPNGGNPDRHQRAYDLDIHNGKVFVAHGEYGLVVLSEVHGKVLLQERFGLDRQPYGHRSKIMSISINDKVAIAGVDNITQPTQQHRALNGLLKFAPSSPKNHTRHQYDPTPNKAGIIAYARMQLEGTKLFINNLGNLQLFETTELKSLIVPTWRRLSVDMHNRNRNVRPHGELLVENDLVYGCGSVYLGDVEGKPDLISYVIQGQ